MKFLDLFSGIGGFRLGMEMAGHECVGHIEWDKFAQASYIAMHKPKESEYCGWDIRNTKASELPAADCWCFGFPCQDISIAGKQTGFKGQRSSLFFTVTKLIRELEEENRPSTLLIENVKNLLSVNGGWDFAKLFIELDEIGYDAEWQLLNSKHFGVPQNRERVFIVGHLRGRSRREVFPIGGGIESPGIEIIGSTAPSFRTIGQRDNVYSSNGSMGCLSATDYKQPKQIAVKEAAKKGYALAEEGDSINFEHPNSKTRRVRVGKGVAQTLTTSCNQAVLRSVRTEYGKAIRKDYESGQIEESRHNMTQLEPRKDGISNTLTTVQKDNMLIDGLRIRKLTPRECFRLQGFPDEYFDRAAAVNSNSQLYKQAGNSVTVNVIYEIAKRL